MALAFSLKNDLTIALILAIVHLGLSAGFATGMLGPGSAIQKIPVVNVITDPSNYLTVSLIACVAMTIILGLAVADVDEHDSDDEHDSTGLHAYWNKTFKSGWHTHKCHPGSAFVTTIEGTKTMAKLKVGDMVWNGEIFEPVVGFSVYRPNSKSLYYDFVTENGHTLNITGMHYLYANGEKKLPKDVKVGDVFETASGLSKVKNIGFVELDGTYHPHTPSKKLYVNGVKTSVLSLEEIGNDWKECVSSVQTLAYKMLPKTLNEAMAYGYGNTCDIFNRAVLA